jgi:hypothetical protein
MGWERSCQQKKEKSERWSEKERGLAAGAKWPTTSRLGLAKK